MKALSIRQPWAGAVALGWKDVENRSRMIQHRGDLLIHSAGNLAADFVAAGETIKRLTGEDLPVFGAPNVSPAWSMGAIIAVVRLRAAHRGCNGTCSSWAQSGQVHHMVDEVRLLARPVPAFGRLGVWTPDPDVLAEVKEVWPR